MKVYLAAALTGCNAAHTDESFRVGKPRYLLESFISGEKVCDKVLARTTRDDFLLDSGAFSYMNGTELNPTILDGYVERYIHYIKTRKPTRFFEMDVDTILGIDIVHKLRTKIERETGQQVIPVWHKSRGLDYWKRMVAEYDYVAIGGLVMHVKQQEWPYIRRMVNYAAAKGVKVHGLGFTKTQLLDQFDFYSVDSTSWVTGGAFGNIHKFDGHTIVSTKISTPSQRTKSSELKSNNFIEWCKYQRYMDRKKWPR